MPDALPDFLASYMERQRANRADAVNAFLGSLTDRERALFQDAAVMGYVRGSLYPRGEEIPLNAAIVAEVIDACFVLPDLYPAVNADPSTTPPTENHAAIYVDEEGDPWVEYLTYPRSDHVVGLQMVSQEAVDRRELEERIGKLTFLGWHRQA